MANGNDRPEKEPRHWPAEDHDFVQVNGEGHPPLFVRAGAIDAVGIYGGTGCIIIMDSGKEIVAKGTSPSEVVSLLALGDDE